MSALQPQDKKFIFNPDTYYRLEPVRDGYYDVIYGSVRQPVITASPQGSFHPASTLTFTGEGGLGGGATDVGGSRFMVHPEISGSERSWDDAEIIPRVKLQTKHPVELVGGGCRLVEGSTRAFITQATPGEFACLDYTLDDTGKVTGVSMQPDAGLSKREDGATQLVLRQRHDVRDRVLIVEKGAAINIMLAAPKPKELLLQLTTKATPEEVEKMRQEIFAEAQNAIAADNKREKQRLGIPLTPEEGIARDVRQRLLRLTERVDGLAEELRQHEVSFNATNHYFAEADKALSMLSKPHADIKVIEAHRPKFHAALDGLIKEFSKTSPTADQPPSNELLEFRRQLDKIKEDMDRVESFRISAAPALPEAALTAARGAVDASLAGQVALDSGHASLPFPLKSRNAVRSA